LACSKNREKTDGGNRGEAREYKFIVISAFPLKTNKSQKQWFDHVRVCILWFLLEGGQVYVALTTEMNHRCAKVYITDSQHLFHSPFSYLAPYILLNIFLSKISRDCSSFSVNVHASAPHNTTGLISVLYIIILVALDKSRLLNRLIAAKDLKYNNRLIIISVTG